MKENSTSTAEPHRDAAKNPNLGVVAIGRNEGERLRGCLESLAKFSTQIVYVDSGSTDGSVELARRMGAEVVELDTSRPFAAGRARNEGFRCLRAKFPRAEYVQFVDGDCQVVEDWRDAALGALAARPDVAVVAGRRRERYPEASIYNTLCDVEWDTPIGEAMACGGDSLMRVAAFETVGGFDDNLIAGEEPELCARLRARGFRILRIDAEMTLHDASMFRFSQWWRRTTRSGHASAELASLHGRSEGRPGVRTTRSNFVWAVGLPTAIAVGLRVTPVAAFGFGMYGVLLSRIYRRQRRLGRSQRAALAYATSCVVGKFPESLGAVRFWVGRLTGRRSRIIEYKR